MAANRSAQECRFTVVQGPAPGSSFAILAGRSEIGRQVGMPIQLTDATVSRRHAEISRSAAGVTVVDLGSANGTFVNRVRLKGPRELRHGDELRLGAVVLRFSTGAAPTGTVPIPPPTDEAASRPTVPSFGDVRGPVQTGGGQQYSAGRDQYVAGKDQYLDQSVNVQDDYDPWDELFQGRGPGRALMAIGGLIALIGFGMWMYVIFSGFGGSISDPFEIELVPGVPMGVVGFVAFGAGGVLAAIGSGMSKSARKREERLRRERGRQPVARKRRDERR